MRPTLLILALYAFCATTSSYAQITGEDDLNIFGYWQGQFLYIPEDPRFDFRDVIAERNYGKIQQLNLMFSERFSESFGAFINVEFIDNYNSSENWGSLSLEEAWIRYRHSDLLNVKAGQLIPAYGNLNEVKNRFPYLPYIIRPIVYESSFYTIVSLPDYLPNKAFLEAYGAKRFGGLTLDYAAYVGNAGPSYTASSSDLSWAANPGHDTSNFNTVGGRVGFRYDDVNLGSVKAGFSMAVDKDNWEAAQPGALTVVLDPSTGAPVIDPATGQPTLAPVMVQFGNLHRHKMNVDFSYRNFGFDLTAEYIMVQYDPTDAQQAALDAFEAQMAATPAQAVATRIVGKEFDKTFYYATLGYRFLEDFYIYGSFNHMDDKLSHNLEDGVDLYTFGLNYTVNDNIVIKAQGAQAENVKEDFDYTITPYALAVSVLF
jgi:hypothetical protein